MFGRSAINYRYLVLTLRSSLLPSRRSARDAPSIVGLGGRACQESTGRVQFEVATVRPFTARGRPAARDRRVERGPGTTLPGRFRATNMSLSGLSISITMSFI